MNTLEQIYNEKEKAAHRDVQKIQFQEKGNTRKSSGTKSNAQVNKRLKKPHGKRNKESSDSRARLHPAKLPTWEKKLKRSLSGEENHREHEAMQA